MTAETEFSVVWRWRTDPYRDEFSDERRKVYKTEAGARRLLSKLLSKDGKYEKHTEYEPTRYDDGFVIEHWQIDYARIEQRAVGPWTSECPDFPPGTSLRHHVDGSHTIVPEPHATTEEARRGS